LQSRTTGLKSALPIGGIVQEKSQRQFELQMKKRQTTQKNPPNKPHPSPKSGGMLGGCLRVG